MSKSRVSFLFLYKVAFSRGLIPEPKGTELLSDCPSLIDFTSVIAGLMSKTKPTTAVGIW